MKGLPAKLGSTFKSAIISAGITKKERLTRNSRRVYIVIIMWYLDLENHKSE